MPGGVRLIGQVVRRLLRVAADVVGEIVAVGEQAREHRIDRRMDEGDGVVVLVGGAELAHLAHVADVALHLGALIIDACREGRRMRAQDGQQRLHLGHRCLEARIGILHLGRVGLRDQAIDPVIEFNDQAIELAGIGDGRRLVDDEAAVGVVDRRHACLRVPDAAADDQADQGDDGCQLGQYLDVRQPQHGPSFQVSRGERDSILRKVYILTIDKSSSAGASDFHRAKFLQSSDCKYERNEAYKYVKRFRYCFIQMSYGAFNARTMR